MRTKFKKKDRSIYTIHWIDQTMDSFIDKKKIIREPFFEL